ncbi:bis(5'-nucleosyl)-tetraphosphatase PrpE [Alkalihalobacillus sp. CinArs1]|uniref:bis(5'-nucleosyl)-tetraphosphatase PrpE n=1 Tax=Alkalihalobacillus sp. CinArs1 TaxID=2995314 RepID=UPI0022DD2078|nr:bis(5'-nucleosyl)-tetraphosphatase PrpE [Alkalihalobacillus sp. CinArs1]
MFDIIGDIHGCYDEFVSLTHQLGYEWNNETPIHPENRKLVFLGDLTDRGPQSLNVIEVVTKLVENQNAYYCPGNHCNKLYRYMIGRNVQQKHGLETTVEELSQLSSARREDIIDKFTTLYEESPLYLTLDNGSLIVAHAGLPEKYIGQSGKKVKTFVLYGDVTGETHANGMPVRRDWAATYKASPLIVYGHTPVEEPRWINRTVNIDTGCVFGGKLTALQYPELTTFSVPSSLPLVKEKFRAFP